MSGPKDNGGAAFPQPMIDYAGRVEFPGGWGNDGMSLRDYFAAKALASVFDTAEDTERFEVIAKRAYLLADAMLKARGL